MSTSRASRFSLALGWATLLLALGVVAMRGSLFDSTRAALPSNAEVLTIIRRRVEQKQSAGIVVGMMEPDGRARFAAWGDPGPRQPLLDSNSVFEIGSITKVFTATMLAQLVQEERVRLDDPAQKYLPASVTLPTRDGK